MPFSTIVDTATLASHLDDPGWLAVDARAALGDLDYGRHAYDEAHVPGAVFADLNRDLSTEPGNGRGRHPLPDLATMVATFGSLGIGPGTQVVVYDDADGMYASRLWWMLRYLGHDAVAVLDGGWSKWRAEDRPVSAERVRPAPREFRGVANPAMTIDAVEVDALRADASQLLVDSRSPDRYRGENETIDPVAGHIPGARNRFFKTNVNADGTMRAAEDLRREFEALLDGVRPERVAFYCGSGVTACQNLLAIEHAGLAGARLYPGSWSEWISDPAHAIATGDEEPSGATPERT
jgi:thiosulfate/3-mercaptopyruvate sulfurtransferase